MKRFRFTAAAAVLILAVVAAAAGGVVAASQSSDEQALRPTRGPADRRYRVAGEPPALEDDAGGEAGADPAAAGLPRHRCRGSKRARLGAERDRSRADQGASDDRGGTVAAEDPAALRLRHHPRIPDGLPDPARRRRELRSAGRVRRPHVRRARVGRRRAQADVCTDGRRLPRATLGSHLRSCGRGSLSELRSRRPRE